MLSDGIRERATSMLEEHNAQLQILQYWESVAEQCKAEEMEMKEEHQAYADSLARDLEYAN